eukprot:1157556-Pelagomonas_calceolata.AAC.4
MHEPKQLKLPQPFGASLLPSNASVLLKCRALMCGLSHSGGALRSMLLCSLCKCRHKIRQALPVVCCFEMLCADAHVSKHGIVLAVLIEVPG